MFTGIVQAKGRVTALERSAFGARLTIDRSDWSPPGGYTPAPGDSICVSGVCLTVVDPTAASLAFDVITETLARTNLGELAVGREVNLEPSVTPNQPLGGHFMQGHVDGVGEVARVLATDEEVRITIRPPAALLDYIVPKGSIAIDGVSLTLASVADDAFDVALIPTTLDVTTLGSRREGDRVNLEGDILAKTVVHQLRRMEKRGPVPELTRATLERAGFL